MVFCDRATVERVLRGRRIALVGSGPGVLDNAPGFVDGHEVVVRVNNYKLSDAAGRRCDVYYSFFGNSVRKRSDELVADGVRLCICKCPNGRFIKSSWHVMNGKMAGIDFRAIYARRRGWWFCPTYVPTVPEFMRGFDLLGRHVPTTGFAALIDVLSYAPYSVYMTGFDFFESMLHNVDEPWKPGRKDDPIGHVPQAERAWLAANAPHQPIGMDERLRRSIAST